MILTTKRHGRSKRDIRNLVAHLNKQVGQQSHVVRIDNVPLSNANDVLRYMSSMRDASRAKVACHHISISPRIHLTDEQRDEAVQRILSAMGAEDHAYILWKHSEKARTDEDIADEHYHLVVGHIGPDGRALSDSMSYVRLEVAARTMEVDFGEAITHSRLTKSVAAELRRTGRDDVADLLTMPPSLPPSAMSSRTRAKADRKGLDLPEAQAAVRAAWTASDGPAAFRHALRESGFDVATGSRPNVFIVTKGGIEVGALDRVVREKRAAVAARMKEEEHDTAARKTEERRRSDLFRGPGRQRIRGELAAPVAIARRTRERGAEPARPDQRFTERNRDDLVRSERHPRSHRSRALERAAVISIGRDDVFRKLRATAEALASGKPRPKSRHRRAFERADVVSLSGLDLTGAMSAAVKLAAGGSLSESERRSLQEARMRSLKPAKALDHKTKMLAEIAPRGFDASRFANDLHMVQKPNPGNPTARVMTRDGGWVEFDPMSGRTVRTWGPTGRAQVLAQALADALDGTIEHLAKTASVGANADALRVTKLSEDKIKSLTVWWTARGYVATAAADGCWIDAGRARIRDAGDRLEIHGGLTDAAVAATVLKAKEGWDGAMCLDGDWTQAEQDKIWLAAQRAGVEIQNCEPSKAIQAHWAHEQDSSAARTRTISAVRTEMVDAQDLIDAAKGDRNAVLRLPGALQAFVSIHLDDEQRKFLATQSVANVIPELGNFRSIGAVELEEYERTGRRFVPPQPEKSKRGEENTLSL